MDYFIHDIENKRTYCIHLPLSSDQFAKVAMSYIKDEMKMIPAEAGMSKVHPKDSYNHDIGRKLAKEKMKTIHYHIISVHSTTSRTVMSLLCTDRFEKSAPFQTLFVVKHKKRGTIKIYHNSEDC